MIDEPVILTAAMARELARMHLIRPDNAHKPLEAIAEGRAVVIPAETLRGWQVRFTKAGMYAPAFEIGEFLK